MPPKGKPKRSVVWNFYKKVSCTVAACTICQKEIRFHSSTTNLMDHLKRKHPGHLSFQYPVTDSVDQSTSSAQPMDTGLETGGTTTYNADLPVLVTVSNNSEYDSGLSTNNNNTNCEINTSGLFQVSRPRKKSQQSSVTPITSNVKQKKLPFDKTKEIENLLVDIISEEYLPFTLVEQKKFIKLLKVLEPNYKIPNRKTLSHRLVNERYLQIKQMVYSRIVQCQHIALAVDMWTSIQSEEFFSVTAHFVQGGKFHSAMLCSRQIDESLTAENIALHIKKILDEWKINTKVFAIVTDNSSVMIDVADKLSVKHLVCAAHSLNLVASDVFDHPEMEDFSVLRQKCRKVVSMFKNSTIGSSKLVECQKQLQKDILKLKQETLTRWNSTFKMMERLVEVKEALVMAFSYVDCGETLTSSDWEVLEDCIPVFEPLHELAEELSSEKYSTSSVVIPLVRGCQNAVQAVTPVTYVGTKVRLYLLDALSKRMTPYETSSDICAKATILDPRFKRWGFGVAGNATITIGRLISEIDNDQFPDEGRMVVPSRVVEQTQETDASSRKKKSIWKYFLEEKDRSDAAAQSASSVKEDLQIYLSSPLLDMEKDKTDPISYWRKYEESMKILANTAYKYLSVPATSVPSERVFSKVGQIFSECRNALKAKTVDKLMFVNANAKFS